MLCQLTRLTSSLYADKKLFKQLYNKLLKRITEHVTAVYRLKQQISI